MADSYAATRIHVMSTKLIQSADYDRLLKMSDKEVINYLQETEYKEDVLNVESLEDLENVDRIIALNSQRTVRKLQSISSKAFQQALTGMLRRNDRWNLRVIAESLAGEHDPKEALEKYKKQGTVNPQQFVESKTIPELAKKASKYVRSLRSEPKTLSEFFDSLNQETEKVLVASDQFIIDEENILYVLMAKREGIAQENINKKLKKGGKLSRGVLREAAGAKTVEDALKVLESTRYGTVIANTRTHLEEHSFVRFEDELHKEVLRQIRKVVRTYPLGIDVIIHYLIEKEMEHENLRVLLKGKRLGLDEEFIKEHLVV